MATDREQKKLKKILCEIEKRPTPVSFPIVDDFKEVNYYSARWFKKNEPDAPFLLFKSIDNDSVKVGQWDGAGFANETLKSVAELASLKLEVWHYYGLDRFHYRGVEGFSWSPSTVWLYVSYHLRRMWRPASQKLFNLRDLRSREVKDILEVLANRRFTDDSMLTDEKGTSRLEIAKELHTKQWSQHPGGKFHLTQIEVYLESLIAFQEVEEKKTGFYSATGKGIRTLEEWKKDDRRHRQSVRIQYSIIGLTAIIAFASLVQSGIMKCFIAW